MQLVELTSVVPDVLVDLRYALPANFTGHILYDETQAVAQLDTPAARALATAAELLRAQELKLVIWDAYRPEHIQQELRAVLSDDHYVAPDSNHCRGLAVDVTLAGANGALLDMGTDFDEFSELAHLDAQHISE